MFVSDILKRHDRPVQTIDQSRSVLDAIDLMNENRIGSLLVTNGDGRLVGIMTERDVLRASAKRHGMLDTTEVSQVMSRGLITASPEDRVTDLLSVMTEKRIRHLPIMQGSELKGMVSIGDLVKIQLEATAEENRHLKEYINGR